MVYRDAELAVPDVHRYYSKHSQHSGKPVFVFALGMKVEGVALGTLIAQYAGLLMAYLLWLRYYRPLRKHLSRKHIFEREAMVRFFQVNRDIFLRTLCLVAVTVFSLLPERRMAT